MDTIAIYLRLSSEDGDLGTASKEISNSISNQRKLITDYISSNSDLEKMKIEEYIDDGYSGTNFNRPSFQRLLKDAKSGSINVIITKDFSRLGRDYLEVGNYLEYIFPILGIRYISVNDAFDSYKTKGMTGGMSVALKNIINSMYSEDLSKKVCAAQSIKAKSGEVIQALVHYGYKKNPENIHQIIPDDEAAMVVKRIFNYAEEEISFAEIARRLNEENIPSITQYYLNKGIIKNFSANLHRPRFWTGSSVSMILRNESYKGTYIWGKTDQRLRTKRATNTRYVDKDKEDWIIIENHHEPIITKEQFDRVQQIIKKRSRTNRGVITNQKKITNLFRCPYCKRKMDLGSGKVSCMTGKVSLNENCYSLSVKRKSLEDTVVATINQIATFVLDFSQKMMKKMKSYDIIQNDILAIKKEISKIPTMKMKKYDLYKQGKISAEQYKAIIEEIYSSKELLEEKLRLLNEELQSIEDIQSNVQTTQEIANEMILCEIYDADIISKFVKYIDVYSESELEIVFDVDDVFFNDVINELEREET